MLITVLSLLPLLPSACGLPNERGSPRGEVPTPDEQLLDQPEPAPREVRDAARHEEGALVEGPLVAVISGTASHPDLAGRVMLTPHEGDTVRVDARLVGLPPGDYVYAVHTRGDCSDPDGHSMGVRLAFDRLPRHHDDPQLDVGRATAPGGAPPRGPPGVGGDVPGLEGVEDTERTTAGSTLPEDPEVPQPQPAPVTREPTERPTDGRLGALRRDDEDIVAIDSDVVPDLNADSLGHLVGRAVVVHAGGTEPVACGVLVLPAG